MGMIQTLVGSFAGGTENALAAVDVPRNGRIIAVDWTVHGDADADGEAIRVQLAFGSTVNSSNDARSVISTVGHQISLTTSGVAVMAINKFVGPLDVAVSGGERLYIHSVATAGMTGTIVCHVHYSFDDLAFTRRRT